MENLFVFVLWLFFIFLGLYTIALDRRYKRMEEVLDVLYTEYRLNTTCAEKNVESGVGGVEV